MAAPAQWQAWAADADAALEMPDYKSGIGFFAGYAAPPFG